MKKDSFSRLFLLILTAVAAVAGFILRRCQLAYELQANGSLANGSRLHIILGILLAVYAVAAIICLLPQQKLRRWREVFRPQPVLSLLFLLAALGFAIGNLLLLFERPASTAEDGFARVLALLLPLSGLAAALCTAGFALCIRKGTHPHPLLQMVSSIYLVLRLFLSFQSWSVDPSIHDYCFRLVAAICCMLGTFQLSGFSFDKGKRRITLFWTLCGMVACLISMADALEGPVYDLLIQTALLLSMTSASLLLLLGKEAPEAEETGATASEQ